jgi:hypothetical protein
MRRLYRRFERWRSAHTGRLPIPEALWASAAEVARECGVFHTAKVLRLEYGKLKRIAEGAVPVGCSATASTSFVELVAPPAMGRSEWQKLTLFLRQPGSPLDNNICERALKKAILHRKNPLFYKTQNGAHLGDLFMSLICSCQLCEANAFEYLTELQQHGEELSGSPQQWMPWNYREVLKQAAAPQRCG